MLTWVKMKRNVKILNKRAMGRKSAIFAKFWVCTVIIKKNEDYFTFILFCKDSRFAIRMKKSEKNRGPRRNFVTARPTV